MVIHATLTRKDGSQEEKTFRSMLECAAYLDAHNGEYAGFKAEEIDSEKGDQKNETRQFI